MLTATSSSQSPYRAHALPGHVQALGLTRSPFPVTPDDEKAYFFSDRLNVMYEELKHFILLRKGFMLVTGDVGVGKTTLTHLLLGHLEKEHVKTALIINTFLQDIELFRAINRDFNLAPQEDTLDGHLQCLNAFLLEAYNSDYNCVLIIDDAQRLDINSLELIRQLSNLETARDKLIQIVLVAQPEIMDTLNRFDLRQLRSRIALHVELQPLTLKEIDQYLHHRLSLTGSNSTISVSSRAMRELHRATGGFPRLIHLVMDRCLFGLVARNNRLIDVRLMRQAIAESHLYQALPRSRWKRPLHPLLPVATLSIAGMMIIGLAFYIAPDIAKSYQPAPVPARTAAAIEIKPRPIRDSPAWRAFLDAYPGLTGVAVPELREASPTAMATLGKALIPYRWTPVMVDSTALKSCRGYPTLLLNSTTSPQNRLALFRTDLPLAPIPFSLRGDEIRSLQSRLLALGFLEETDMDSIMGGRTANALAKFQNMHGLAGTGQPDVYSSYSLECAMPRELAWKQ